MNDQEVAAIINGKIFTKLTPDTVKKIVTQMKDGKKVDEMITEYGDGANGSDLVQSMVQNNIMQKGEVIFGDFEPGSVVKTAASKSPEDVIDELKNSNLRGRGGAGFPTGMKWDFCNKMKEKTRYVICNADEGEPGTFKDRVILTELPQLLFEGMVLAGYAVGAKEGLLYLRREYRYLKGYLEDILAKMIEANLLGKKIAGKSGFDFDIRIQFGAGAYICGEESALLESAEGKRGEPRNRPPFPVEKGYKGKPTIINNVETLCSAAKVVVKGADWFKGLGTEKSTGTKLLSISGDCKKPGIYEIEWGVTVNDILKMAGADNTMAVQVGGPSGTCINKSEFNRKIAYEDLPTGGSMIIMNKDRDILKVVKNFTEFFIEESCGSCVTCRAMPAVLLSKLNKIMDGNGTQKDIEEITNWGSILKDTSRCGLGQTSANPLLSTIKNFKEVYDNKVKTKEDYKTEFDLAAAVEDSCDAAGRTPNL